MTLDTANQMSRLAGPVALSAGNNNVLNAAAGHIYTIKRIKIVNTDTVNSKTFQVTIGGYAAGNAITPVFTIDAGGMADSDDFIVMTTGDFLGFIASATGLTVSVYGLDQN